MKEDNLNSLRQQDNNLREAIRQEQVARPRMSADLNARLMAKVTEEPKRRRVIWPWVASACAVAVIAVLIAPPKPEDGGVTTTSTVAQVTKPEVKEEKVETPAPRVEETSVPSDNAKVSDVTAKSVIRTKASDIAVDDKPLVAQASEPTENNTISTEPVAVVGQEIAKADANGTNAKVRVLSERDMPITHTDNLKRTPEEIALMKKQANEAYIKWVELELEIAKFNLEHTASNDN